MRKETIGIASSIVVGVPIHNPRFQLAMSDNEDTIRFPIKADRASEFILRSLF